MDKKNHSISYLHEYNRFRILFSDNGHWNSRNSYKELILLLLDSKITGREFRVKMFELMKKNEELIKLQENNLETETDFVFTSKSIGFSKIIGEIVEVLDFFDTSLSESNDFGLSEDGLKDWMEVQILPKIEKFTKD